MTDGYARTVEYFSMTEFNALRPITQRLTSTPVKDLPYIVYFLASSIATCGQALQAPSDQATHRSNDNTVLVHKLKTRISSLLQERSHEGRFTAVVLIKAVVEAGGREGLSSAESWVRGLLALLGKNDSVSTKKLCLIAITRIFSLTQRYPTLVREITTPLLPSFITICLNLIKPNIVRTDDATLTILSPFLEPVFRSLSELLPHHPTIFRPFTPRLNSIALNLIGDASTPLVITDLASDIITALHFSASKNAAAAEWTQTCKAVILSCHTAADLTFRSVIEDWECPEEIGPSTLVDKDYDNRVHARGPDTFGLAAWIGVHYGIQRLVRLVRLLMKLLSRQTAQQVSFQIGLIIDLAARLTAVTAMQDSRASQFSVRPNAEVGRDERDELWMELPTLHIATLDLLSTILESFSGAALPIARIVFDQTIDVFNAEQRDEGLRIAAYRLIEQLLCLLGSSLDRSDVNMLTPVVKSCCADSIFQGQTEIMPANGSRPNGSAPIDADSFVKQQKESLQCNPPGKRQEVHRAAFRLLPYFLSTLPASAVPHSLRTEIDRTAILAQNTKALLASVLKPPLANKGQYAPPSIMPFLARTSSGSLAIEGLLRPRMPLIRDDNWPVNNDVDVSEEDEGVDSEAVDPAGELCANSNTDLPEGSDLLDRLEHSLNNSPLDTKTDLDGSSMRRTVVDAQESFADQFLSKQTTKRDFAALNESEAKHDQETGIQDVKKPHVATGPSSTDVNKRRRLADKPNTLDSEDGPNISGVEAPILPEPGKQVAAENSSERISTQVESKKATDIVANTISGTNGIQVDPDDESDSDIPEVIYSSSEDGEG
jgi:pre-rRNA-processing protein RIX1